MKCTYCGYNNAPDAKSCAKCLNPLAAEKQEGKKTERQPQGGGQAFGSTIAGAKPLTDSPFAPPSTSQPIAIPTIKHNSPAPPLSGNANSSGQIICPNVNCKYPNVPGAQRCVYCGNDLSMVIASNDDVADTKTSYGTAEGTVPFVTNTGNTPGTPGPNSGSNTINIYASNASPTPAHTSITLELLERDGGDGRMISFASGNQAIALNRESLDPQNNTITSKVQAVLELIDGKWTLTDKSDLRTTFISPSSPIEVKDGDLVLMGNRKFKIRLK